MCEDVNKSLGFREVISANPSIIEPVAVLLVLSPRTGTPFSVLLWVSSVLGSDDSTFGPMLNLLRPAVIKTSAIPDPPTFQPEASRFGICLIVG